MDCRTLIQQRDPAFVEEVTPIEMHMGIECIRWHET